jgi:predicted double-glycine peptidase
MPVGAMLFLVNALILNFRPEWIAMIVSHHDAMFIGNWQLESLAIMFYGALGSRQSVWAKMRIAGIVAVALVALRFGNSYHFARMSLAGPEKIGDDFVVLQTSEDTCSAAAAATLLRLCGIEATEAEMARLCLTRRDLGTAPLGIWRGLRIKASTKGLKTQVMRCNLDDLLKMPHPCLIALRFSPKPEAGGPLLDYIQRSSAESEGHTVVYLQTRDDGSHEIADPAEGAIRWTNDELDALYDGVAYILIGETPPFRLPESMNRAASQPESPEIKFRQ